MKLINMKPKHKSWSEAAKANHQQKICKYGWRKNNNKSHRGQKGWEKNTAKHVRAQLKDENIKAKTHYLVWSCSSKQLKRGMEIKPEGNEWNLNIMKKWN